MPVTSPTASAVHIDGDLSNFAVAVGATLGQYVSMDAIPSFSVDHQSNKYHKFDLASWLTIEARERADGDPAPRAGWKMSEDTYYADVLSVARPVTDRMRANQDSAINIDRRATRFVTKQLLRLRERKMIGLAMDPATYGSSRTSTLDLSASDADPIGAFGQAKDAITAETDVIANTAMMSAAVYTAIKNTDAVIARLSGMGSVENPAIATRRAVAAVLEVDNVYVINAATSAGERPLTVPNRALLYNYEPGGEASTLTAFNWTSPFGVSAGEGNPGIFIKVFRDEDAAADIVEGNFATDFKATAPETARIFNVTV